MHWLLAYKVGKISTIFIYFCNSMWSCKKVAFEHIYMLKWNKNMFNILDFYQLCYCWKETVVLHGLCNVYNFKLTYYKYFAGIKSRQTISPSRLLRTWVFTVIQIRNTHFVHSHPWTFLSFWLHLVPTFISADTLSFSLKKICVCCFIRHPHQVS